MLRCNHHFGHLGSLGWTAAHTDNRFWLSVQETKGTGVEHGPAEQLRTSSLKHNLLCEPNQQSVYASECDATQQ